MTSQRATLQVESADGTKSLQFWLFKSRGRQSVQILFEHHRPVAGSEAETSLVVTSIVTEELPQPKSFVSKHACSSLVFADSCWVSRFNPSSARVAIDVA